MRTLIVVYLLLKSAWKRKLTRFDSDLAKAIQRAQAGYGAFEYLSPDWLRMIANMEQEVEIPEAFAAWWFEIEERWYAWCGEQARKFKEWME